MSLPHRHLKLFTWHVHGSYLYYLSQLPYTVYVPYDEKRNNGYAGRTASYPWPDNVVEVEVNDVRNLDIDCVIFQSRSQYEKDQYQILSAAQRDLPKVYIEHDPPREHPTDTQHPVQSPQVTLVHVTPFNQLMWDAGPTPTRVIDHGVMVPEDAVYSGKLNKGIVIVNNMALRGRRLGFDIWQRAAQSIPLDLYGMGWEAAGGVGEVKHSELPYLLAQYRFFFNPIRYTSLGLAVCEAMAVGLPIVGLATTEMVTAVPDGVAGYLDTREDRLHARMQELLQNPERAAELGAGARSIAQQRFSIQRFISDWCRLLEEVTRKKAVETAHH